MVEPGKSPYAKQMENDYWAMQKLVDGGIEFVPLPEPDCHLYCNEEGKLNGMPGNRRMDHGDIICGIVMKWSDKTEVFISKLDQYIDYINMHILPFIDYSELDRSYQTTKKEDAKGILNFLHTAMLEQYGDTQLSGGHGEVQRNMPFCAKEIKNNARQRLSFVYKGQFQYPCTLSAPWISFHLSFLSSPR